MRLRASKESATVESFSSAREALFRLVSSLTFVPPFRWIYPKRLSCGPP